MSTPDRGPLPESRRKPHPKRLPEDHPMYSEILAAHEAALERGDPMYRDPWSGYWVQTARSIWETRECCDLGCRHCPFLDDSG